MLDHPIQTRLNEVFDTCKDRIAIEYGDVSISYSQLDEKSNRIANTIIDKGIKTGSFIGILLEDRIELIAVILGILKTGCVFVPLDSRYPTERLKIMLHSTDTKFLFIDNHDLGDAFSVETLELSSMAPAFASITATISANRPALRYSLNDSIYIYFTSGTTGKPKAIIGQNKGLLHFINWEIQQFDITGQFRVSQFTSQCHDPFLRDIFVPLCTGGTMCIPPTRETLLEPLHLKKWLEQSAVNLIHCTPGMFNILNASILNLNAQNYPALKYILMGGERIIPAELSSWYAVFGERVQLVNFYGPTETTLVKIYYLIMPQDAERKNIPIGQPIAGAKVIILDQHLRLCNQGEVGEIYIRTPYMTIGYCNEPELTARYFIRNPFSKKAGDLVYKTGDLGRMLPAPTTPGAGTYLIEFLGRIDRQVKIRGFRVELLEIENVVLKHEAISRCVVDFREDEHDVFGDGHLILYYIPTQFPGISPQELRTYMQKQLPIYMLPSQSISLDHMPLTENGKIDIKTLRGLRKSSTENVAPPADRTEQKLWEIWCDILRIDNVGVDENFLQVGGNSLNIMTLISRIHREFDIRLSLGDVFQNPTIKMQAKILNRKNREKYIPIEPIEKKEYYALSSAQQRLYVLQRLNPGNIVYNLTEAFLLEGESESLVEKFRNTFHRLIERHEVFRTSFHVVGEGPVQRILAGVDFKIEYYDFSKNHTERSHEIDNMIHRSIRPFELAKAPLLRVFFMKIEKSKHLLVVDFHHIISDGISRQVLIKDFAALYQGEELPPLELQYKDFSEWEHKNKQNPLSRIKEQETYWLKMFDGEIPKLNLPLDFESPPGERFESGHLSFIIDDQLYNKLKTLQQETSITLYMALLVGYFILLSRYSRQEDIVIGSPISGRSHPDLENIVGMFINMLAMRNKPGGHKTIRQFISEVRDNTLNAMENGDYQFDDLVSKLGVDRDTRGIPLSEVVFNMLNLASGNPPQPDGNDPGDHFLSDLKISPYTFDIETMPFNLLLDASEASGAVYLNLNYASALFKKTTIEKMSRHYIEILNVMSTIKDIKLADIKISHELMPVKPTTLRDNQEAFDL
ncbi:MAG: hypothetical protein QG657_3871 [Acidobacteriota bacterium]|nr:hypothetical protein [Acidobacteriota bacterium]